MPELHACGEHWRAGTPVRLGDVSLLPIERTVTCVRTASRGGWLSAVREPCALVVRDARGMHAFDANGSACPLQDLRERVPGIDALLASL